MDRKTVAVGVIAVAAVLLLLTLVILTVRTMGGDGDGVQAGVLLFEAAVPRTLSLGEGALARSEDGTPGVISGDAASLQFEGRFLDAIHLPVECRFSQKFAVVLQMG